MQELFRAEADTQIAALTAGLLELERGERPPDTLAALMRAAHSLKGAARFASFPAIVRLAHALEDCFEGARSRSAHLQNADVDLLLRAVDVLGNLVKNPGDGQLSLNLETSAGTPQPSASSSQPLSLP